MGTPAQTAKAADRPDFDFRSADERRARRLILSPPAGAWEREADAAADAVLRGERPSFGPPARLLSRGAEWGVFEAVRAERALRGAGHPLPDAARGFLESRFGRDFSAVRAHHDAAADDAAGAIGARAFAAGEHLVFGRGAWQPDTPGGLRLIAHELAHVVQQRRAGLPRDLLYVQRFVQGRTLAAPPVRTFGPGESALGEIDQIRKTPDLSAMLALAPARAVPRPEDNTQTQTALGRGRNTQRDHAEGLTREGHEGDAEADNAAAALTTATATAETAASDEGKDGEETKPPSLGEVIARGIRYAEPEVADEFEDEEERAAAVAEATANKGRAEAAMGDLALQGVEVSAAIKQAGLGIEPRLVTAAGSARARIEVVSVASRDAIVKSAREARGRVSGQESAAKRRLEGEFQAAVKAIDGAYRAEKQTIELHYGLRVLSFGIAEIRGGLAISRIFKDNAKHYSAAGAAVGERAKQLGEENAKRYEAQYAPDGDVLDGEDYYRKKRAARVNAARETGKQYAASFKKQGSDAAAAVAAEGDKDVITEFGKQVRQESDNAEASYKKALTDLESSYKAAKDGAKTSHDTQQASIKASAAGSRAAVSRLEKALLKQLDETALQRLAKVDADAAFALGQLIDAVDGAAATLEQALAAGLLDLEQRQAPDADSLEEEMAVGRAGLDEAQAASLEQLDGSVAAAVDQLLSVAEQTAAAFGALTQQATDQSKPIVESFGVSTGHAVRATVDGLRKASADFVKGAADTRESERAGVDDAYQKIADYITDIETSLPAAIAEMATKFQGAEGDSGESKSLMAALYGRVPETTDILKDIKAKAEEAADAVKPAWREAVAFVLTIVITIVVAVAIAALVASGVGFGLGLLLAAGIGALGGVAKAGVEAWRAEKPLTWKDVGKAAVLGAIDGMLQFAGGRALKALKLPDTGWKKAAAEGGSNFAQGISNDFAGLGWDALVDGKPVTWRDFAGAAAANAFAAGLNVGAGGLFGKTKLKASQFEDALYKGGLKDLGRKEITEGLKAKGKDMLINVTTNTLGDKELLANAYNGKLTLDDVKKTALRNVAQEGITAATHYGLKGKRYADKDAPPGVNAQKSSAEDRLKDSFSGMGKAWDDYRQSKKAGGGKANGAKDGDVTDKAPPTTAPKPEQTGAGQPASTALAPTTQKAVPPAELAAPPPAGPTAPERTPSPVSPPDVKPAAQQPADATHAPGRQPEAAPNADAKNAAPSQPARDGTPARPPAESPLAQAADAPAIAKAPEAKTDARAPAKPRPPAGGQLESEPTRLRATSPGDEQAAPKPAAKGRPKSAKKTAGAKAQAPRAATPEGGDAAPAATSAGAGKKPKGRPKAAETQAAALAAKQPVETALADLRAKLTSNDPKAIHAAAESLIKSAGDWKRDLKSTLKGMDEAQRAEVENALVEARDKIVKAAFAKVEAKYPGVEMFNVGTKSFGSDIDVTIKPRRPKGAGPEADPAKRKRAVSDASRAARMMAQELRAATGGETDATLDTNVYAYIGEDDVHLKSDTDRRTQSDTNRVAGLAEQKRGMTAEEWKHFKDSLELDTISADASKKKGPIQRAIEYDASAQLAKDLRKAEAMAKRLDKARADAEDKARKKAPNASDPTIARMARDRVLTRKRSELALEMGKQNPNLKKVLRLQADILWFEPDAYSSRAAVDLAVGGQTMRAAGSESARNKGIDAALETVMSQMASERKQTQPDPERIAALEKQAADLVVQRRDDTLADLKEISDGRTARGAGAEQLSVGDKLSNAAGAASSNLGMMKDHIRHAESLDGEVKAAAKYGARIMKAEGDVGVSGDAGRAAQFGAFVQGRAPGLAKEDADAIGKRMLEDFAARRGSVDAEGKPHIDDEVKRAFVKEIQAWGEQTTRALHLMQATHRTAAEPPAPAPPRTAGPGKPPPGDEPGAQVARTSSKPKAAPVEAPTPVAGRGAAQELAMTPKGQGSAQPSKPSASSGAAKLVPVKPGRAAPDGLSGRGEGDRSEAFKTQAEAQERYHTWADEDPTREVALVYDHDTNAYEVVQGQSFTLKGEALAGNKTVVKHFHHGADFAVRLPSPADYAHYDARTDPSQPWVSRVTYVNEMGEYQDTVFGFHPGDSARPPSWWVKYAEKDGSPKFQVFSDPPWAQGASYSAWKMQHLTVVPARPAKPSSGAPESAPSPARAIVAPAAGEAGAPSAVAAAKPAPSGAEQSAAPPLKSASARVTAPPAAKTAAPPTAKTAAGKSKRGKPAKSAAPVAPAKAIRVETVEEFLARGGKATVVPPQTTPAPRVTAAPRERPEDLSIYGEGPEAAAIQGADKRRAGMAAKPKHHVFPQEKIMRTWFEKHGFKGKRDIDNFTLALDEDLHQAIHGGGDYRLGRKWQNEWNTRVRRELLAAEKAKRAAGGRKLTYTEVRAIVLQLMREYGLPGPEHFEKY